MRLIAQLLMVLSLIAATLAASVAYHVPLDAPDRQLIGLTLQDEADVLWVDEPGEIDDATRQLTAQRLKQLRTAAAAGAHTNKVRVREFSFRRWRGRWVFAISILTMAAGALVLRWRSEARRQQVEAQQQKEPPRQKLHEISAAIEDVTLQAKKLDDPLQQNRLVIQHVSHLQTVAVPAFLETQSQLIAEMGLGAAAEVLDRFATAERLLNRAWSAASDHDVEEAIDCLGQSQQFLQQAIEATASKTQT